MSNMREFIDLYERWETQSKSISVTFPVVLRFEDYHEISFFADQLSKVTKTKVSSEELEFSNTYYWGIFWVGKSPTKTLADELLKAAGFEHEHEFDDDDEDDY